MYLARHGYPGPDGVQPRIVASEDPAKGWIDLRRWCWQDAMRRGAGRDGAQRIATAIVPESMSAALAGGDAFLDLARAALADPDAERMTGQIVHLAALDPSGYRDCMAFEGHFSFGFRWRREPIPEVMYEMPVSYCGNPLSFIGPNDDVPWPSYSEFMDFELELGIVIGRPCTNLTPEQAPDHIAGLTILNDFSARDIQAREMTSGLGPAKGKHFACAAGPYLTTMDSLPTAGLRMQARVNGESWCDANSREMIWSINELVAWASQGEQLMPGMLIGSGTCNGGSAIETGRRMQPGDTIELEIEGLGTLRNRFGRPQAKGWVPNPRTPGEAVA